MTANIGNDRLVRDIQEMVATFDHYIIMDDVEVKNISEQITALGVAGPKAEEVLTSAGFSLPAMAELQVQTANEGTRLAGQELEQAQRPVRPSRADDARRRR